MTSERKQLKNCENEKMIAADESDFDRCGASSELLSKWLSRSELCKDKCNLRKSKLEFIKRQIDQATLKYLQIIPANIAWQNNKVGIE